MLAVPPFYEMDVEELVKPDRRLGGAEDVVDRHVDPVDLVTGSPICKQTAEKMQPIRGRLVKLKSLNQGRIPPWVPFFMVEATTHPGEPPTHRMLQFTVEPERDRVEIGHDVLGLGSGQQLIVVTRCVRDSTLDSCSHIASKYSGLDPVGRAGGEPRDRPGPFCG
jgi:hypothetical protein